MDEEIAEKSSALTQAAEKIAAQKQEVLRLLPMKEALRKANNELGILKAKYQRVMDFIEDLKLTQKLGEFLKIRSKGVKR